VKGNECDDDMTVVGIWFWIRVAEDPVILFPRIQQKGW